MEPATALIPAPPAPGEPLVRGVAMTGAGTRRFEGTAALEEILADPGARVWVDVEAANHASTARITELLSLHPLIAEDIAERNQRAKVEEIEGTLHIVLFWIAYAGAVTAIEVDMVLDPPGLSTVENSQAAPFHCANFTARLVRSR